MTHLFSMWALVFLCTASYASDPEVPKQLGQSHMPIYVSGQSELPPSSRRYTGGIGGFRGNICEEDERQPCSPDRDPPPFDLQRLGMSLCQDAPTTPPVFGPSGYFSDASSTTDEENNLGGETTDEEAPSL